MSRASTLVRQHPVVTIAGAIVVAIIVVFGLCEWRGWPFLRGPAQRMLQQRLERDVTLGPGFRLHLLGSIRLRTDALTIGPPRWAPQDQADRFFDAHDVELELPWSTVWDAATGRHAQPLRVRALRVGQFDATLWRRADGRANWDFASASTASAKQPMSVPQFDSLMVRDGRLSLDDAPTGVRLQATASTTEGNRAAGAPRSASTASSASASLPAPAASPAAAPAAHGDQPASSADSAGLHVEGQGHYRKGEFRFALHSSGVLPLIAPEGAQVAVPITLQGHAPDLKLSFDGQARDVLHFSALQGRFMIAGASLGEAAEPFGVTLPTTAPFEMQGRIGKNGELWTVDVGRFAVGSSRLAGDFRFDQRPKVPLLTGDLRGDRLDLKDLGPAFGAGAPANPPPPSDKLFPDREFDIPSLQAMNADVGVDLKVVDLHTAKLDPFEPLRGHIRLHDGVLTLSDLDARMAGGALHGQLVLDGRSPARPVWRGDLRLAGVQLAHWINISDTHAKPAAAKASGEQPATHYITGALGAHLQFTGTGRSVAQMLGSLDGTITAWINDGTLSHLALEVSGIDIAQSLGVLVKGDNALKMQCAVAQFSGQHGELHANAGIIDTSDTTVLFGGGLSLGKEQMDLVMHADPKDVSIAALRSPVHVDGPFLHPHVSVEKKPIATRALAALALGAINPLAAVIPLIDTGQKAPEGCRQALEHLRGSREGVKVSPPAPKGH
jgi:uncharacterized protein involved in outer membrane biogenesis